MENGGLFDFLLRNFSEFIAFTGFANATSGHYIMILVGLIFLYLGIWKKLEPMLLVPIGFGILLGNIPFFPGTQIGIYEEGSLLNYLHFGLLKGVYPPLIFLGLGAMIDFSAVISNPKLVLIGIAAQLGIFAAYIISLQFGYTAAEAGAIGIIGSADGPTAIFLSSRLAPELMGAIAISAYSYMALVPVIQPPFMVLMTNKKERLIKMRPPRMVSQTEKTIFPIVGLLLTCLLVPAGLPLLGMLFFGNLIKECGVTKRLATTAAGPFTDILTILIGLTMGASTQADTFLTTTSLFIFGIGAASFVVATISGIGFVKFLNLFLKEGNKINPLIGNAGVSALPDSARVSQFMGLRYDSTNHLLMHAMGPTVASTIGSAVVAGILLGFLGG
jgi:sodium ion-translocating decarboxylase, beta subunit